MTEKKSGAERAEEKAAAAPESEVVGEVQPPPTNTAPVGQGGLQIDGFGLPVNGVARARVLGELGGKDPARVKTEWNEALADKARQLTEKYYG